ncbi:hypothetical protein X797_001188 [Metarhizium robertsii]|uniref:Uncharacterized protein n=2 Tax=Metarhizium robertsii TaxID=568076 RepID=E9EXG0_METRA|nr:uncharacterized protein MAA_04709 [Metarhizium robertsii ARSEF 23]EFY99780.1 hypothetical protein MAA_04709 [Metarhizium robertsii ARSEF 23]EXV06468.1 hypothetical protein X797_001188 [Metarhizium robertsii]
MAYEMTSPQGQTIVHQQHVPARRGMSRWWPVSFFIAAIIFFIIGGGLMGAWAASFDGYAYYTDGNWYGAIACFVIASLLKLTAWILLIVWCVKGRNRAQPSTTVTYVNPPPVNGAYAVPPQNYFQQPYSADPTKSQAPAPVYQNVEPVPMQYGETARYCGNCGNATTTPFCAQCGGKVF